MGKLESLVAGKRGYREISIEAPKGALPPPVPVPEGMRAWRNAKNGFVVVSCHYTADPEKRNDDWYTEACKNLREDQIERELEINFDSKAGTKAFPYLEHNETHFRADPPNPIPANWKIIVGMDYGATNPTAVTWYAVDEHRRFWAFDEFYCPINKYPGGIAAFATYLKTHPFYPRVKHIVADPSIFNRNQNILEAKENGREAYGTLMSVAEILIKNFGIHKLQRANNERIAGIMRVHQMLNWRGERGLSSPYLFIGRKCQKMWWELCNLIHKPDTKEDKNAEEDVVKRNDHAFDELKYALLSQDLPAHAPMVDPRAGFATLKTIEDEIDERYNDENRSDFELCFASLDEDIFAENF